MQSLIVMLFIFRAVIIMVTKERDEAEQNYKVEHDTVTATESSLMDLESLSNVLVPALVVMKVKVGLEGSEIKQTHNAYGLKLI